MFVLRVLQTNYQLKIDFVIKGNSLKSIKIPVSYSNRLINIFSLLPNIKNVSSYFGIPQEKALKFRRIFSEKTFGLFLRLLIVSRGISISFGLPEKTFRWHNPRTVPKEDFPVAQTVIALFVLVFADCISIAFHWRTPPAKWFELFVKASLLSCNCCRGNEAESAESGSSFRENIFTWCSHYACFCIHLS